MKGQRVADANEFKSDGGQNIPLTRVDIFKVVNAVPSNISTEENVVTREERSVVAKVDENLSTDIDSNHW